VIEEQHDYQRASSAYLVWPLALATLIREAPAASRWTRIHTRQALTFGLVGADQTPAVRPEYSTGPTEGG
jgi:hypothetical protein